MSDRVFALDANVFIEAHRRYYAFDIAPMFWRSLVGHAASGRLESIDRIKVELERGRGELAAWATREFSNAFVPTDEDDVVDSYKGIMQWVYAQRRFSDGAKAGFAGGADGWLVAYARVKGRVIVTHEVLDQNARRKVPIPNVCEVFNVSYVNTFEMMRELGMRWI